MFWQLLCWLHLAPLDCYIYATMCHVRPDVVPHSPAKAGTLVIMRVNTQDLR